MTGPTPGIRYKIVVYIIYVLSLYDDNTPRFFGFQIGELFRGRGCLWLR